MGNLYRVKLFQFSVPSIALTLDILSNQGPLGILKHPVNLFQGIIWEKRKLRQVWTLREIGEEPSPMCFDSHSSPNSIINILIWNCREAMKPNFKKTVMDLV